ncbi:MAG: hypothetical protein HY929_06270, partial [Euryarchaeota archaeon]|nr:hypothetical protein [Euryarchaeota archaeon]
SKSEVIRSGIRKIGEEHGLISTDARYQIKKLQSIVRKKSPDEIMDKLDKISEEIWKKRKKIYA